MNGASVERGQLDQNRIPKTEFHLEKTSISLDDRLKLRKLYQSQIDRVNENNAALLKKGGVKVGDPVTP